MWMSLRGLSQRGLDRAPELSLELAGACGFKHETPSQPTISRFIHRMGMAGIAVAVKLMVLHLVERGVVSGRHVALDSAPLEAYFWEDPDAEWGYSVKLGLYRGYKVHVAVDAKSELPVGLEVTPANVHDSRMFRRLLRMTMGIVSVMVVEADAAYDSKDIRGYAATHGVKPAIARNPRMGRHRRMVKLTRMWAVEHNNSRHLDILRSMYRVRGIHRTRLYAYLAAMTQLSIAVAAESIGRPDKARAYRTLIKKSIMNQP